MMTFTRSYSDPSIFPKFECILQTFLLLTLLSMMNCAVHQILKIALKITLLISLCAIYFTVATLQGQRLDIFDRHR